MARSCFSLGHSKGIVTLPDKDFRDLDTIVPGDGRIEPSGATSAANTPPTGRRIEPKPSAFLASGAAPGRQEKPAAGFFRSRLCNGEDVLGVSALLAPLVELAAHKGTETPLGLGIFGGPGSGKSFSLKMLVELIEERANSGPQNRFLRDIVIVPIHAGQLNSDPIASVAGALFHALRKKYTNLAGVAAIATVPRLREANERLQAATQAANLAQQSLEEAESRRGKLVETLLYPTGSSTTDSFARSAKLSLDRRFQQFGIDRDTISNFKELIRLLSKSRSSKFSFGARTFFGFESQKRLIRIGIALLLLGLLLHFTIAYEAFWAIRLGGSDNIGRFAAWLQIHMDWVGLINKSIFLCAGFALFLNVWRAIGFLRPILRGTRIFIDELTELQRDADFTIANQTQQVIKLKRKVESLALSLAEAEKRTDGVSLFPAFFFEHHSNQDARDFLVQISTLIRAKKTALQAPERIIFVFDHFESVGPAQADRIVSDLQSLLQPDFVLVLGLDLERERLGRQIEKLVDIPFQLAKTPCQQDLNPLLCALMELETGRPAASAVAAVPLETPLSEAEKALLLQFVTLAGRSPRTVARFFNIYRLCRSANVHKGSLALWLALDAGEKSEEIGLLQQALQNKTGLHLAQKTPSLVHALAIADSFDAKLSIESLQAARTIAAPFSFDFSFKKVAPPVVPCTPVLDTVG